jgi:hypothetical protein
MFKTIQLRMVPTPSRLVLSKGVLFAILALEVLALFVARLAGTLQFDNFAFADTGSNLTVVYLINHGYRPTIDFAYHYGLLPLMFGRLWFGAFGLTPIACTSTMPVLDILLIWGMVRFAANERVNIAGILIILLTASVTIFPSFINLTHGIEPIFLLHALADQAGGNRRRALVLTTFGVFVKPSMSYFLGFILLSYLFFDCFRYRTQPIRAFLTEAYPALLVGVVTGSTLALTFGIVPVMHSILPSAGLTMYRAADFGFFNGAGRLLLSPPGATWSYYFTTIAGPWIAYTAILSMAAITVTIRRGAESRESRPIDRTSEVIISCAILNLSFVLFFFGNSFSWIYYFYILVLGLAATGRLGIRWEILVACLAFAVPLTKADNRISQSLASHQITPRNIVGSTIVANTIPGATGLTYQYWFTTRPTPETAGLWAASSEREEWVQVLAIIRGHRTAMLESAGCADLLFSEFVPPVTLFLIPGGVGPSDLSRKLQQLGSSSMIVMPRSHRGILKETPEIGAMIHRDFSVVFQGDIFTVFSRNRS